jgi:ELWxxDGT repeat protein
MSVVLFAGFDANGNNGLWVTDGTASGTHELTNVRPKGVWERRTTPKSLERPAFFKCLRGNFSPYFRPCIVPPR